MVDMEQKNEFLMYKHFHFLQTGKRFVSLPDDTNIENFFLLASHIITLN